MSDKTKDPNKNFMVRLGQGEKTLRILLSQEDKEVETTELTNRRYYKGGQRFRRPDDENIPRQKKGVIQFFDMGRKWDGSVFADVQFHYTPIGGYVDGTSGVLIGWATPDYNLSRYRSLESYIIDYDFADIESMHPRLQTPDDAYWFNLELWDGESTLLRASNADPNFTTAGWKVPASELALGSLRIQTNFYNRVLFHDIYLGGLHASKITATYSYSAAAVTDFRLQFGDKIFMMPFADQLVAQAQYFDTIDDPPGFVGSRPVTDYLASDLMVPPRRPYLDPMNENYLDGLDDGTDGLGPSPDDYKLKRIRLMRLLGYNLVRRRSYFVPAFGYRWQDAMDPTTFPHAYDSLYCAWAGELNSDSVNVASAPPNGVLLGIIKRGTDLFFCWRQIS